MSAKLPINELKNKCVYDYTSAGIVLFPCEIGLKGRKKPKYRGWQRAEYNPQLDPDNLGDLYGVLLTDEDLVLDYDPRRNKPGQNQLLELWKMLGLPKPTTLVVKSGGQYLDDKGNKYPSGYHIYFKKPPGINIYRKLDKLGFGAIEIKSKGQFVIGAGSLLPSGNAYVVERGTSMQIMDAPQALLDFIAKATQIPTRNMPAIIDNSKENQDKFIAYLKIVPPAVERNGGDHATFLVAAKGKDYGLSEDVVLALMLEYFNQRCLPPWENSELKQKVTNAFKYTQGVQGNQHHEAILAKFDADKSPYMKSKQQDRQLISTITAVELMQKNFPESRWAVDGILPEGLTVIAGSPKIGKSWMAYSLACAVSTGGNALGNFPASRGQALYFALEDNLRRLQGRLRKLSEGHTVAVSGNLILSNSIPRYNDGGLKALDEWLDAHPDCRLVIIDTLARFSPEPNAKMNAYENDYRTLAPIQYLAISKRIALVVITHLRKQPASDPLEQVTGSAGITGAADAIWLLKRVRGEARGTLKITGRDVEEQELAVEFNKETCQWKALGDAFEYQIGKERKDILNYIKKAGEPVAPKEVAQSLNKPEGNIKSLMRKMVEAGQIIKLERGKYVPKNLSDDF